MPRTIVQNKRDKRKKETKQRDFLEYLIEFISVTRAAKKAKIGRQTVYDWINNDKEFKKAYEQATEIATMRLEDEAVRRSFEGVMKPVFQGGRRVGSIREFSDTLLIVLLKAKAPDKYRERTSTELTGKGGKELNLNRVVIFQLPDNGRDNNKAAAGIPNEGAEQQR